LDKNNPAMEKNMTSSAAHQIVIYIHNQSNKKIAVDTYRSWRIFARSIIE
jgi:hypothetical protein